MKPENMTTEERIEKIAEDVAFLKGRLANGLPGQAPVCLEHTKRLDQIMSEMEPIKRLHWKLASIMTVVYAALTLFIALFGPNLRTLAGLSTETKTTQKP